MLHYTPQHVSSSTLLIIRRTNCITTASGIVTLCKQPYIMQVESGMSPLSTCILYGCLWRVKIPEAVVIQLVLLMMSSVMLETCWGMYCNIYRVSQEECARLRESVPYVKVYRYNPKHLCPKLNGYGDNVQRSLKLWQLLHTYWLPNTY